MALSLANGCRMWYTLRAGLLAGVGAFPVCFGWLPGAPSSCMPRLYHAIRVCVNSYAAYYSHKIYTIIVLPHCALCALRYTLTAYTAGGDPGRFPAVLAGGVAAQFAVLPALTLVRELERFKGAEMVWCQEEPKNQGGWTFVEPNIEWVLTRIGATHSRPRYVGRAASASPATGLASQHKAQQEALVNEALTIEG